MFDTLQGNLQPLPDRPEPSSGSGFPQLSFTGSAPPSLNDGPGDACPAGAPVREYDIAISETNIVYSDLHRGDQFSVAYHVDGVPAPESRTPMVLRANDGECLRVNLRNNLADRASLNVGELLFDPQRSYGGAVGLNYDSTVAPGAVRAYEYYADTELGITVGLDLADVDAAEHGAYAGIVVEPAGATYTRPGQAAPLPEGGIGVQADIHTGAGTTREFVALFSSQDKRIGANSMPYPAEVQRFSGLSYAASPLAERLASFDPKAVFDSAVHGDPRWVVTVPQGTPLTFRVAQPWGQQPHVPTLEGHRYPLEPDWVGSEQMFNDVIVPGMSYQMPFIGGAGGDIQAAGDFLFLDRRQPFLEKGLWMIVRSTADGTAFNADRIFVRDIQTKSGAAAPTTLIGRVGPRPAGDFVSAVTIHEGAEVEGRCLGREIGKAAVTPGSGAWHFEAARLPATVCVSSPAGGVASFQLRDVPEPIFELPLERGE